MKKKEEEIRIKKWNKRSKKHFIRAIKQAKVRIRKLEESQKITQKFLDTEITI